MYDIIRHELRRRKRPIGVAIVGLGFMGYGLLRQLQSMDGFRVQLLVSRNLDRTQARLRQAGVPFVITDTAASAAQGDHGDLLRVTDDYRSISQASCDIVVEMSGDVPYATIVTLHSLDAGLNVATMNAELHATVGHRLRRIADDAGLVVADVQGDQPGSLAAFMEEVRFFGFNPVMAGNIKGFLDHHATPESLIEEGQKRGLSGKQVTSFTDGTKIALEMALVSNHYGMTLLAPGMHGHTVESLDEILNVFYWTRVPEQGCVDYVIGRGLPAGIFVVGTHSDAGQASYLQYLKLGDGPLYMLYRPFHLCHLEAPYSIARMVLYGKGTIHSAAQPTTAVVAIAKRDLLPGDVLDGIGGYCCYGEIRTVADPETPAAVPIGLADGATVKRAITKDELIAFADVTLPVNRAVELFYENR